MQNILFFLLVAVAPISLVASDKPYIVAISPTSEPHTFRDKAVQAMKSNETSKAATYAALNKIFTRMDTACIHAELRHDYETTVGIFRDSVNFKQQTGPVFHPFDTAELRPVVEDQDFKNIFRQQVRVIAGMLVDTKLPPPYWVLEHKRINLELGSENAYTFRASDFFVPKHEWFARRATALNQYYNDTELFPAGAPTQIILQAPRPARAASGWCALQ